MSPPGDADLLSQMALVLARHVAAGGAIPEWVPDVVRIVFQEEHGAASQEAAQAAQEPRRIHGRRGSFDARHLAEICQVSLSTATRVIALKRKAPDLAQQVRDGTMKLGEATRQLRARIATMKQGARTDLAQNCAKSQDEAAEKLNVSGPSVKRARTVLDFGTPELVESTKGVEP